jgi:hypothetical protein
MPLDHDPFARGADHRPGEDGAGGPAPAAQADLTAPHAGPPEPGAEPMRTLLWTAATYRPLEEVAALVRLLKRTGSLPNSGDEALRAAAVARPLDEVRQLVVLLNEPGCGSGEADTALRAAAVGRSVDDVARLVAIFRDDGEGAPLPEGVPDPVRTGAAPGDTAPTRLADIPADPPAGFRELRDPGGHVRITGSAAQGSPRRSPGALAGPVAPGGRSPARAAPGLPASPVFRSVLRWPAAAALLVVGMVHLPTDLTGLRSGGYPDAFSLVVTVLCLALAGWLAVQDTLWVWAAGAATAVGVVAVHTLTGFGAVDVLENSLGADFGWAGAAVLVCSVGAAVLAVSALTHRPKPAAGAADDA